MRVVLGPLLLLLSLCGSGARGQDGGLGEAGEIEQTWRNVEAIVKESQSQMEELRAELMVTKVHVELLQAENAVKTTELKSLESRLTATESRTRELETEKEDLQSELKARIDQLEKEIAEKPKVAFSTALTDSGAVGPNLEDITLKFSKVFTNIGDAYNPATGLFTAPVKGVYYLQFTIFSYKAGYMGIHMYKNDQRLIYNREYKANVDYDYSTNSLILELMEGDTIYLTLPSGYKVYDDSNNHSTFSGSLLFQ